MTASIPSANTCCFLSCVDGQAFQATVDPANFQQAMRDVDAPKWKQACEAEINNRTRNGTLTLIPRDSLPPEANLVKSTWAFKGKIGTRLARMAQSHSTKPVAAPKASRTLRH
eukprot:2530925-Pleurochrysis_carterae.AAC.3